MVACAAVGCAGLGASAPDLPDTGSTLARTWVDPGHTGVLVPGPDEPLVQRSELAPPARLLRPLATFAQITDAHVTDEESPARVEMLDRLGPPFTSAFRPQEALSPFVLAAIVRSVNRVRPQTVFETGDLIDNAQQNEMDQATAILRGGRVDPNSGQPGYDGVQDESNADPLIYRPAVDAPRYPRLLAEAERPFTSPGLRAPWYPLPGNHDLEVQGNVPATPSDGTRRGGDRKLLTVDRSTIEAARGKTLDRRLIDRLLAQGLPGQSEFVPADPRRRELSPAQAVAALRSASGHGGSGAAIRRRTKSVEKNSIQEDREHLDEVREAGRVLERHGRVRVVERPPFVPSCLIAICEATGPRAIVWPRALKRRRGRMSLEGLRNALPDQQHGHDDRERAAARTSRSGTG